MNAEPTFLQALGYIIMILVSWAMALFVVLVMPFLTLRRFLKAIRGRN